MESFFLNQKFVCNRWLPTATGCGVFAFSWSLLKLWWPLSEISSLVFAFLASLLVLESQTWGFRAVPSASGTDTCLVTGGTHGIGFEIAKLFARDGFNVIIVSRYEDELQQAKIDLLRINPMINVITITKDLYSENAAFELFEEITTLNEVRIGQLHVNYLVNNVGMCIRGEFLDLPLIDQLGMMQLNLKNLVVLSHLFGNRFKDEIDHSPNSFSKYRIMNLSSFASLVICPFMTVYSGTKAFVHSFSIAFAEELKAGKYKGRITCTSVCPGYTAALGPAGVNNSVAWVLNNCDFPDRPARTGYKAMMEGRYYVLVGMLNNFTYWITSTITPVKCTARLGKLFNCDWEDLSWNKIQKSAASRDLRAGLGQQ